MPDSWWHWHTHWWVTMVCLLLLLKLMDWLLLWKVREFMPKLSLWVTIRKNTVTGMQWKALPTGWSVNKCPVLQALIPVNWPKCCVNMGWWWVRLYLTVNSWQLTVDNWQLTMDNWQWIVMKILIMSIRFLAKRSSSMRTVKVALLV